MEEQSEIVRSKKEFAFASSTILSQVGRGIIVGLIVGIIVGSFRFLIEKGFHLFQSIIQCVLYLIAPYIALQLCSINRSLVGEIFIIFLILFCL